MTPFYLSLISLLFIIIITLKFLFNTTRAFKNLPPGPQALPLIGSLHQIKKPLHQCFYTLFQKHGDLFSLWFGYRFVVVVSSLTLAQECFNKHDIVLANRPTLLTGKYMGYNSTTVIHSPYGDHWRNLRRILSLEVLSSHRLNSFYEIRRDEIMRLLQTVAKNSYNEFSKVELTSIFSGMTFNTITRMVSGKTYYGDDCNCDVEETKILRELIKEILSLGSANNVGEFLEFLRWFDLDGLEKRLKKIGKTTDAFLQGLIDEHRLGKQNDNTMIDNLLMQQQSQPQYYNDQIIKGIIAILILAGTDTSSVTLDWAMSNLLNHPEIIKKAKEELDTQIGQNRLVEESDISKLPYLQNIIYETLRLHPALPLLVPHMSSADLTLGKYNIPQNTIVLVNAWVIHRDPNLWNDPTCFKPERFEKEGELNKLLPFGLGRRACPGENLAQRTLGLTLASLIQCFEWKLIGEEKIDMTEASGTTMPKKVPLQAMCKVRNPLWIKNTI